MADQSLYSPVNPHFFQPLLPSFRTHLNIPVAFFSKHLQGRNDQNKIATLRSDVSDKTWLVKMDGLKLTDGWEDLALAHDLRNGDIIVFRYEGEMVFHVTVLGPSCCEIQYRSSHNISDDRNDQTNIVSGNSSREKRLKKNPRNKVKSSSNHSQFVAKVSTSGLRSDQLYVPLIFARSNGLNKMNRKKIVVLNEEGRSWKLHLKLDKGMHTYIRPGWRSFCAENGMSQGHYTFKLVQKSGTPVIRLCRAEHRPKQRSEPESSSHHSYFEGSATPSGIKNDQLHLPRSFVSSNGLEKGCTEIVLKNEWGCKRTLVLKHFKSPKLTFLKKGWTSFCQANMINVGDSYKFKLVGTEEKPVLFLCPAESNREKTPLECSEGRDDVKSLSSNPSSGDDRTKSKESEEESIEDKHISQECLEIKKRKYWSRSRCRAFVDNMEDDQTNIVTGNSLREKRVKKNPRKKVDSSSDHSSFVANVSASSRTNDRLYLPQSFARSNGLDKMSGKKMVLLNEEERSWELNLTYYKAGMHTYVRPGWRRFCAENGMSQGQQYTFKLVRKSGSPVMRLYLSEHRPKPESSSHHSYFTGSVSASSLKKDKQYLPRSFVSSNGMDNGCREIVLKNEHGIKRNLVLTHYKPLCFTIIKRGWTSFCQVNGLKAGDSFKFNVVKTGEKPVLCLCPADSNSDKTPLECPEGSEDVKFLSSNPSRGDDSSKSKGNEEESFEDKNISEECLEIKKRQYWLRCRASSSYSQNRFVILTLTPPAFRTYKLFLPRDFTNVNGINKPGKITMLGQDGVKWEVNLFQEKIGKRMRFGKGWREFCEAQGVKIDESFVLELIWEEEASPVLKFCTKLNSA